MSKYHNLYSLLIASLPLFSGLFRPLSYCISDPLPKFGHYYEFSPLFNHLTVLMIAATDVMNELAS